jgi:quercetin dioxygenase-like cupin family protein
MNRRVGGGHPQDRAGRDGADHHHAAEDRGRAQAPVSFFVEEDGGRDDLAVLIPAAEKRPVYTSHKGITLNSISGPYARFLMAGARATVVPGASSGRKPMQHPGEELVHVTEGVLEFSVAGQVFQIHPGDTLHFRGDQPHTLRNPGDIQARAVWLALRPQ